MRFSPPADFMCHICNQIARIIIGTVPFPQNPGCIKKFNFKFTLLQLFSTFFIFFRVCVAVLRGLKMFFTVLPRYPASLPWQLIRYCGQKSPEGLKSPSLLLLFLFCGSQCDVSSASGSHKWHWMVPKHLLDLFFLANLFKYKNAEKNAWLH